MPTPGRRRSRVDREVADQAARARESWLTFSECFTLALIFRGHRINEVMSAVLGPLPTVLQGQSRNRSPPSRLGVPPRYSLQRPQRQPNSPPPPAFPLSRRIRADEASGARPGPRPCRERGGCGRCRAAGSGAPEARRWARAPGAGRQVRTGQGRASPEMKPCHHDRDPQPPERYPVTWKDAFRPRDGCSVRRLVLATSRRGRRVTEESAGDGRGIAAFDEHGHRDLPPPADEPRPAVDGGGDDAVDGSAGGG